MLLYVGFVAVAGPTEATTGVLQVHPSDAASRVENMARFAQAALDLTEVLQGKNQPTDHWTRN